MRVNLSRRQVQELQPYIDRVRSAHALGSPGMLVAQIQWNGAEQTYWLTPAFLPHELAKVITEQGRATIPGDTRPGLVINSDTKVHP